jgi:hypothetical protein
MVPFLRWFPTGRKPRSLNRLARLAVEQLEHRCLLSVSIGIDAGADQHAINPNIYGVSYATTAQISDLNLTLNRYGGNTTSTYNWQANADNQGADYYFESLQDSGGSTPSGSPDGFISRTQTGGAQPLITIPTMGWVAKLGPGAAPLDSFSIAKYGAQQGHDRYWPDAGNGFLPGGNDFSGPFVTGNDPNDAMMPSDPAFQQGWVDHLISQFGASSAGGVRYYELDNEPAIWYGTHRDVHPTGAKMDEILNDMINYAAMIKSQDPGALVLGPEDTALPGNIFQYSGYDMQYNAQHGYAGDRLHRNVGRSELRRQPDEPVVHDSDPQ